MAIISARGVNRSCRWGHSVTVAQQSPKLLVKVQFLMPLFTRLWRAIEVTISDLDQRSIIK